MLPTSTQKFFSAAWSRLAIFNHPAWALALLVVGSIRLKFQPGAAMRTIQVMVMLAAIVSLSQQLAARRWLGRQAAIKRVARFARSARSALANRFDRQWNRLKADLERTDLNGSNRCIADASQLGLEPIALPYRHPLGDGFELKLIALNAPCRT